MLERQDTDLDLSFASNFTKHGSAIGRAGKGKGILSKAFLGRRKGLSLKRSWEGEKDSL